MLAWSGIIKPIKAQKIELVGGESQLSSGVCSPTFEKKWTKSRLSELVRWHEVKRNQ